MVKELKLTSNKAYRVVKYLLQHREASQLEISGNAHVAYGWTSEVVNFLFERDIVSKRWRRCELRDPFKLLEIIALERPLNELVVESFRLEVRSVPEGERLLKQMCDMRNVEYGLTGFSGLRRYYEYHIGFPEIHAYMSDQKVGDWIPHGQGPILLNLLCPDHPDILEEAKQVDGVRTCSPIQVAIDLFCSGAGRDAAIKVLEAIHTGKLRDSV